LHSACAQVTGVLFPAGAGVILLFRSVVSALYSVPRRGGGDPKAVLKIKLTGPCSPQGRG